jgi:hypothetical protein
MIEQWWSWVMPAIAITGTALTGAKKRIGWIIGIVAQLLWFVYGLHTAQYGFLASSTIYIIIYAVSWYHWRKQ